MVLSTRSINAYKAGWLLCPSPDFYIKAYFTISLLDRSSIFFPVSHLTILFINGETSYRKRVNPRQIPLVYNSIDHTILVNKIRQLSIPLHVINWLIDFLTGREQCVKLARDCYSEWGNVPCGVPQGTKLGPWLFVLMVNNLRLTDFVHWKYIDETTAFEVVPVKRNTSIQSEVDELKAWAARNNFQL